MPHGRGSATECHVPRGGVAIAWFPTSSNSGKAARVACTIACVTRNRQRGHGAAIDWRHDGAGGAGRAGRVGGASGVDRVDGLVGWWVETGSWGSTLGRHNPSRISAPVLL